MPRASSPRIEAIRVRAVRVPMREPHQTASGVVSESPLVLTDITLDDGTVGHSVIFTYTAAVLEPTATLVRNFESLVKGEVLVAHLHGIGDAARVVAVEHHDAR